MIIYQIKNNFNDMRYVGQTIGSLKDRWASHCSKASTCTYLSNAIQKHNKENFTIEIIDMGESIEDLNNKEVFWIKFLKTLAPNGYNLDLGGGNKLLHEDTKKKLSTAHKGKKLTEEHKKKLSECMKGKQHSLGFKHTNETRKKQSERQMGEKNHNYGKKFSEETRRKIGDASKKRVTSEETRIKLSKSRTGEKNPFYGKKHPPHIYVIINEKSRITKEAKKIAKLKSSPQKLLFDPEGLE